ncbi:Group 3 secretory phospholipase A2 [Larimichthys crocea]|uniref:phospholipase A2 n=1 Tax=Larimichthys crocea TaxID=215358 RepID=A0A6G0IUM7_LARCR|nr:Group 3 secretory phospholipase A2 [Larimichthys crocea]
MWSVFFVFLSYLDRNFVKGDFLSLALDAEKESKEMFSMLNGTFCAKMSTVRENFFYQVSDGVEVVRSVASPAGKLVNCSVIVNHMQVKSFMHECRLGLKEQRAARELETRFTRMDEAKLMCREFKEKSERSGRVEKDDSEDSALQDEVLKRSKRGFTYPGTLWCGAGNMADNYDQLGNFAETDSCCRTHDHCPHVIHAFSSKYGHTNFKWHSICHCDCDNTLKECLRKVNDTSSRIVGQAFYNVIGVPCFEFAYEEQCAERHWYGVCKRYEKFPIAVLRDAVPYDFGGIEVIDELTLAPPRRTDAKNSKEDDKPETTTQSTKETTTQSTKETTTQSTMSGPEEPSLRNVVNAAEDFIKVLATVSTSQSSNTDSDKSETQSSEKKKRKNSGKKKKTTKKQKGKGKGRKRKQKAEAGVKIEEGTAVLTSGNKAEEVNGLSNFISESNKHDKASRNTNRVGNSEYELGGKEEASNEVMKDEPAMDKEAVSITSPTVVQKKQESRDEITLSTTGSTIRPQKAKTRRQRKGGRKNKPPLLSSKELVLNTTDISVPAIITITLASQSFGSDDAEKQLVAGTAGTPIVISKVQRNRSKERGDREGTKKRRKDGSASIIVAAPNENSFADNLPLTVPSVAATRQPVSHRLDIYGRKANVQVKGLDSSFSVLKRQKSQERGLRSRRRKTALPLSSESFHNSSVHVPLVLPTPETNVGLDNPTTAAISMLREETRTHSEWRLFTAITAAPSVITKRHRQTMRQQRKPRRKAMPAALSDRVSLLEQTEQTSMTFTTTPFKVATTEERTSMTTTSASPVMSPIQLSIEKVRAQFSRKKRRKARKVNCVRH